MTPRICRFLGFHRLEGCKRVLRLFAGGGGKTPNEPSGRQQPPQMGKRRRARTQKKTRSTKKTFCGHAAKATAWGCSRAQDSLVGEPGVCPLGLQTPTPKCLKLYIAREGYGPVMALGLRVLKASA